MTCTQGWARPAWAVLGVLPRAWLLPGALRPAGLGVAAAAWSCDSLGVTAVRSAPLHIGTPPLAAAGFALPGAPLGVAVGLGATLRGEKRPTPRLLTPAWVGLGLGLGPGLRPGLGLGLGLRLGFELGLGLAVRSGASGPG